MKTKQNETIRAVAELEDELETAKADLVKALNKIVQLTQLNKDCIQMLTQRGDQYRKCKKALDDLLYSAKQFLADFGTYINEDDWDLPDPGDLERIIMKIKQMKLPSGY